MANTQPPRNPNLKSNVRIRTVIAVAFFTLACFGILVYQLYALQLRDAEHYRTEAVTQQLQDTELPATRGNIYSANGKLLAKSNTVWNIIADPAQSEKNGATETEIRTGAEHIAELLNDGTSADDIYAKLTARNKNGELYQYRVVAQNVEKPVADAIIEYSKSYRTAPEKEGETGYRIAGLSTEQSTTRSYPYGAFASSVIGFCNNDENGKLVGAYGLEKSYEEDLAGTPGRSIAETNVNGEILANTEADVHDAIDGNNLNLTLDGYRPCHNAAEVIEAVGYEPEHDLDNPADSVFCSHGAGFVVPWDQVRSHMHVDSGWGKSKSPEQETQAVPQRRTAAYRATLEEDAELLKIFERTYGPIKRDPLAAFRPVQKRERPDFDAQQWEILPEYLLVDGYNIIFAWDELNALAKDSLEAARHKLMDILCNYQGYQKCNLILVFDAYRVPGSPGSIEQYHNIHVVYTKEAETADMFIEHVTHEIGKGRRVRVATSDGMEQIIILGHGALRVSARMFHEEVQNVEKQIRKLVQGEA